MMTTTSPHRLIITSNIFRYCVGSILLITFVLYGCHERFEVMKTKFEPQVTTINNGTVVLPWDADEDMPIVPVMINGKGPFRFLIDTGASFVVLDKRLVERLHLTQQGTSISVESAANVVVDTEPPAFITSLDVGEAHFSALNALVLEFARMEIDGDLPIQIDGLLGSSLFAHSLLTIDYPKRMVHIAHGSLPAVDEKTILPLNMRNYQPKITIGLEDAHNIKNRFALIDTGNSGGLIVGAKWGLTYSTPIIKGSLSMTASGVDAYNNSRIQRVQLGALSFTAPKVSIKDGQGFAVIGQDLLRDIRLTLDFAGQRARFETANSTITAGPYWSYGFAVRPCRQPGKEGRIVIWIASGSQASQIIKLGDRLLNINGQDTALMSNRAYNKLVKNTPQAIDLTIERSGVILKVSLPAFNPLPLPLDVP